MVSKISKDALVSTDTHMCQAVPVEDLSLDAVCRFWEITMPRHRITAQE